MPELTIGQLACEVLDEHKKRSGEYIPPKFAVLALLRSRLPLQPKDWTSGGAWDDRPLFAANPAFVRYAADYLEATRSERETAINAEESAAKRVGVQQPLAVHLSEIVGRLGRQHSEQATWQRLWDADFHPAGFSERNGRFDFQYIDSPEIQAFITSLVAAAPAGQRAAVA